jgi:SAM-dependent methyltransferase
MTARRGIEFTDADVVRSYANRAPYPPGVFQRIRELSPARGRALDLGCGPGKLAIGLADDFAEVVGVDPSAGMIAIARAAGARRPNIQWVLSTMEDAPLQGRFDIATAGASIHWMEPSIVFPKLARLLQPAGRVVILDGDAPTEADWFDLYRGVIIRWVERLGGRWNSPEFLAVARRHESWIDIEGRESFRTDCRMRLDALIDGEHSRATWARAKIGRSAAAQFDADLAAALAPHGDDGWLEFRSRTELVWGRPRTESRT